MPKSIFDIIKDEFKDLIHVSVENKNVLYVKNIKKWKEIALFIYSNEKLRFDYLMCITAYDNGASKEFGIAYNFHSIKFKHYLEVRLEFDESIPIPSIESIWKTADWHEREAYDMMGILFEGHPDMKRILLPQDWEGHPLRKNYKTPEYYNGMPVPKDKSYWE